MEKMRFASDRGSIDAVTIEVVFLFPIKLAYPVYGNVRRRNSRLW